MATTEISRSLVRLRLRGLFVFLLNRCCPRRERLHGAMATRRIPDPKIGGSIPSEVILLFCFREDGLGQRMEEQGIDPCASCVHLRGAAHPPVLNYPLFTT